MFYGHIGNPSELIRFYFTNTFVLSLLGKKAHKGKFDIQISLTVSLHMLLKWQKSATVV